MNMPQYKAGGGWSMGNRRLHEGGFFRPCGRCGRRTLCLFEDCGRLACSLPGVRRHRTRPPGHQRRPTSHVRPLQAWVSLPGPARDAGWPVDGTLATDRSGGSSTVLQNSRHQLIVSMPSDRESEMQGAWIGGSAEECP